MLISIFLLVFLIFLNAVFACAELAVLSFNSAKLKKMAEEGNSRAKKLIFLTEQPARFLSTIQVAITLAGLLQSAFAAETFADPLVKLILSFGVPESYYDILKTAAIVLITIVLSYFTLVFGELVPKRLAMKKSESMALGMASMLYFVAKAFKPIVWFLTVSTNGILRIFGINPNEEEEQVTEEEIQMMLVEGTEQGTIEEEENEIIKNVFEFNDISIEALCTHRPDIVMLDANDSNEAWEEIIRNNRHTLYPICNEDADDIIGILDTRDYFRLEDKSRASLMEHAVTKPFFVPEGMRANVLFRSMKENGTHFAVLLDEYGLLSGIITLHDLLETLVGEMNEGEDAVDELPEIEEIAEDAWRIEGSASLEEVAEILKVELPLDTYDTFSGYVCDVFGRFPDDNELFTCETDELIIVVHSVEDHIIGSTTVTKKQQTADKEDAIEEAEESLK